MPSSAEPSGADPSSMPRRTTIVSIFAAGLLVALKLGVGLATASLGLISAGIESSGDVIAAILTFFAVRLAGRPADRGHPYGHRRAEHLAVLGESGILLAGALVVSVAAIRHLLQARAAPQIRWYQFVVIGLALVLDLSRVAASQRAARDHDSPALRSNALHFAADMAGSLAVLLGLLAVRAGLGQADAVAALIVAGLTFAAAARLIAENANILMDRAPSQAREAAEQAIAGVGADIELDRLRLRESAGRYFADAVVTVPPGQAVVEGHRAADLIESAVEGALPGSDVVVHVEPRRSGVDLRDLILATALAEPLVREAHDIAIFQTPGSVSVSMHLKFPADLDLRTAHEIAERVERSICSRAGVAEVQTHLEPLERTLTATPTDDGAEASLQEEVQRLIRERTGAGCQRVKLLSTDAGRVAFITLAVPAGEALSDAHRLAGDLEEELRLKIPDIADVVIHTEP